MSSCNELPQMWAISSTKTIGCEFKKSCNGEIGALQDFCAGTREISGADAGCTASGTALGKASCSVGVATAAAQASCVGMDCKTSCVMAGKTSCIVVLEVAAALRRL